MYYFIPIISNEKRWSTAARLLGLRVRIPPGPWMLPLLIVALCQVEISVTGPSLFWRFSTECGVSEYDLGTWAIRRPWPTGDVEPLGKYLKRVVNIVQLCPRCPLAITLRCSCGVWLSFQTECLLTLQAHISVIFGSINRHIMPPRNRFCPHYFASHFTLKIAVV